MRLHSLGNATLSILTTLLTNLHRRFILFRFLFSLPRSPFSRPYFLSFHFLLALTIALAPVSLRSQSAHSFLFRTLSIEQGLSQNSVLSIARDRHGFLWFGTESGLNKFDGYRFTVYLPVEGDPDSLSNSWINALLVDRNGHLWVGTENGLNKYDLSTEKFIRYFHNPDDAASLSSSRIFALFEDRDGRLWVGTDAGLNLLDPTTARCTRFVHDPSNPNSLSHDQVRAIAQDARGFIWIGTVGGGLNRLDPASRTFTHFRRAPHTPHAHPTPGPLATPIVPASGHFLPDDFICSLLIDPTDPAAPIWIGTASSGLVRFDPSLNRFKTYAPDRRDPNQPGTLLDSTINCLIADSDGTLWVGTNSGGLSHFYPDREFFFNHRHQPHDQFSLADNQVVSLLLGPDRILWVGTYRGISQLNLHRQNFVRFLTNSGDPTALSHPEVRAFCDSRSGLVWVGTDGGGVNVFDRSRMRVLHFRHDPVNPSSLSSDRVFSIVEDGDGAIWVGTYGGGLNRLDPETAASPTSSASFTRYRHNPRQYGSLPDDRIRALFVDSQDRLWVGTDGSGLVLFDRRSGRFLRPKISRVISADEALSSLSALTFSTSSISRPATAPPPSPLSSLSPLFAAALLSAPSPAPPAPAPATSAPAPALASSLSPLLTSPPSSRYPSSLLPLTPSSSSPSQPLSASSFPSASSFSSLSRSPSFSSSSSSSSSSTTTTSSFSPSQSPPSPPQLSSPSRDPVGPPSTPLLSGRVFYIAEDRTGHLWIACYGQGLVRYNPATGEALHLTHDPLNPRSLSSDSVINVLVDRNGFIWAGTNGGGLNRLDPATLTFTRFNEAHGLPSSVIYGILQDDDGHLWFSSNRGLSRFDPATGRIKNFDITDGLQSYEFNGNACLRGRDGLLYFGGINGFNVFNPAHIQASTFKPPVVLTSFMISNSPVKPGQPVDGLIPLEQSIVQAKNIVLHWKHRVIAFEFAGLDYTVPEKNQYAYMLEGFEDRWNHVGNRRFASYSNLPPGRYTFRVRATNVDGLWNEDGVSLGLRIIPPFWRTWWFYLLEFLAVSGALYGLYRIRLNRISRRQHELERLIARRTEELRLANDRLKLLAATDELTGLANYRKFRDYLEYEWRRAHRARRPVSLIIGDLDDFKLFNDTYGHQAGDECLKKVAMVILRSCQRSSDLACRYGGDEFAVVLPETDTAGAYIVAERIREAVAATDLCSLNFKEINGQPDDSSVPAPAGAPGQSITPPYRLTICLGLATMNPAEDGSTNEFIARADRALYRAKTSGKNRTVV
ncbi:MAG: diguanylate cyclase [Candidatus Aminicenantes bacterium]|nr:diguanylate cyclase [Candidatus Aminicenantes bacterium]